MIVCRTLGMAALFLASPALAGWQYTSWGMTPAQVVKASKGNARISDGEPGDRYDNSPKVVGAVGDHSSGEYGFRTVFYFVSGRLAEVTANPLDMQQCEAIFDSMKKAYGKPFAGNETYQDTGPTVWQDTAKNNKVGLLHLSDSYCTLHYEPLKDANNSGL